MIAKYSTLFIYLSIYLIIIFIQSYNNDSFRNNGPLNKFKLKSSTNRKCISQSTQKKNSKYARYFALDIKGSPSTRSSKLKQIASRLYNNTVFFQRGLNTSSDTGYTVSL